MKIKKNPSSERPENQVSKTPSGKEVPVAMSMMVDSMVRMIQQGNANKPALDSEEGINTPNGD